MKKITLMLLIMSVTFLSNAQVKFLLNGCEEHFMTWTDQYYWDGSGGSQTWNTPNMLVTANAVTGNLVLVEGQDPVSYGNCTFDMACNTVTGITNAAALSGNIAVIRRGNCEFGTKALAAQQAGAIGCIIVNAVGGPISMAGGSDGMSVTIPTIMVSDITGNIICDAINNGTATGFIGNINGYYANNLSLNTSEMYIPNRATDIAKVYNATNGTGVDHSFSPGVYVRNLGSNNQTNVQIQCKIEINSTTLYTQTSTVFNLNAGDSMWVDFPVFTNTTETDVTFTGQYSIISGQPDDLPCDVNIQFNFSIKPNQFSYARINPNTGYTNSNGFVKGGSNLVSEFKLCNHLYDANANLLYPESVSYRALTYDPVNLTSLTGKTVNVEIYEWIEPNGIYDVGNTNLDPVNSTFNLLSDGSFTYAGDYQDSLITVDFNTPIQLNNNTHYLFCTSYYGNDANFSFRTDESTDYTYNFANPLSTGYPTTTAFIDGNFYAAGFGFDRPSSMVINFSDCLIKTHTDSITACSPYTWVDGNTYNQSTNTPTYTYSGATTNGCDSIVTLNLTITGPVTHTDFITACSPYTWVDGNTYNQNTNTPTYTYSGAATNGCDSIVTLNLTITGPVPSVSILGSDLIASATNATSYQWIDCDSNTEINGETDSVFTPINNGNYAVVVSNTNCSDTSNCVLVDFIGLYENQNIDFRLFPNPANESVYIKSKTNSKIDLTIFDIQGKIVLKDIINSNSLINVSQLNQGIYFVQIKTNTSYKTIKLIIEK